MEAGVERNWGHQHVAQARYYTDGSMGLARVTRYQHNMQHTEPYRLTYALGSADGGEGPARVAMLLRQNPTAGRAFCGSLLQGAPVERVIELVAALRDHLLSSAPAQDSALAAAEAGPSKGGKRRRGRKQAKAVAGSPDQPEEENAEVGNSCLSVHLSASGHKGYRPGNAGTHMLLLMGFSDWSKLQSLLELI